MAFVALLAKTQNSVNCRTQTTHIAAAVPIWTLASFRIQERRSARMSDPANTTVDTTEEQLRVRMLEWVAEHVADTRRWTSSRPRAGASVRSAQTWCRGRSIDCSYRMIHSSTRIVHPSTELSATARVCRCYISIPTLLLGGADCNSSSTARSRRDLYADLPSWGVERASCVGLWGGGATPMDYILRSIPL